MFRPHLNQTSLGLQSAKISIQLHRLPSESAKFELFLVKSKISTIDVSYSLLQGIKIKILASKRQSWRFIAQSRTKLKWGRFSTFRPPSHRTSPGLQSFIFRVSAPSEPGQSWNFAHIRLSLISILQKNHPNEAKKQSIRSSKWQIIRARAIYTIYSRLCPSSSSAMTVMMASKVAVMSQVVQPTWPWTDGFSSSLDVIRAPFSEASLNLPWELFSLRRRLVSCGRLWLGCCQLAAPS